MANLNEICLKILGVMKEHPDGITEGEIREILQIPPADQANFGRRRRELHALYLIEKKREGARTLYVYKGERKKPKDTEPINLRLRAQALHAARGRCGRCGRSIEKHGIVLVVDHRIPREWGGETVPENLEAICEDCNSGKKAYFKSVDAEWMRGVMAHKSVHVRLGETLKAFKSEPVDAATLEFVANQDDWKKRVRELRYLGWEIETFNRRISDTRVSSFYRLVKPRPWPADPTGVIRQYERDRAERNRAEDEE
ncbi:MAG TPA: HNH endonuclease [Bryobacteraceae bacterium]|nr:HNH endonuclease [Bryobacteraceae bacterium]